MANTELINASMDSNEDLTAVNVLDDIIINVINISGKIRSDQMKPRSTRFWIKTLKMLT